ncbi:tyrosine-type recombinase/integrase [Halosimplex pelagicum]|uniref:Tyrosine-type recombinase/integrase n=1 Tax=Halosimplex pelagicum TaxID=869886 RepID=A0A7D5PEH6_9EURY|nr:tyrosine-type recombinase/integrase [Halosimplex pelagicum]QLH82060.1 tyrosine-type recombinase/integrase [Halosimplex pelagicum]
MTDAKTGGLDAETAIEAAIDARLASLDSGNYRANNELVLSVFAEYLTDHRSVTTLEDLDVLDCRRYAQWLRERARDDEDDLSAASAHANGPYFTIVRAFLGWCVDDERLDANPARPNRVKQELPEHHGDHDRQFWSVEARDALLEFVDKRAHDALDESDDTRERAFRDRAIVTTLALTGARGAELFNDPRDEYRNGLRWSDVDLGQGVAELFGKTRERQLIPLTDQVVESLERYRSVLEPGTVDWPVFPTRHHPSLAQSAKDGLREQGWDDDAIESALNEATAMELLREHENTPPPLSKNGARSLMKRLCGSADVDIDGEYLKPHGGRRGLGSDLYAQDAELAQETLRHESIETTHESYREQNAIERRERLEQALNE